MRYPLLFTDIAVFSGACALSPPGGDPSVAPPAATAAAPQDSYWANLRQQRGHAYSGRLTLEPPGDEMLTSTEQLIVHLRQCGTDTLRLPFEPAVRSTYGTIRGGEWTWRVDFDLSETIPAPPAPWGH